MQRTPDDGRLAHDSGRIGTLIRLSPASTVDVGSGVVVTGGVVVVVVEVVVVEVVVVEVVVEVVGPMVTVGSDGSDGGDGVVGAWIPGCV